MRLVPLAILLALLPPARVRSSGLAPSSTPPRLRGRAAARTAAAAPDSGATDGTVTLYVLDSGVRGTHRLFASHVVDRGVSTLPQLQRLDTLGHGTHVASVAARHAPANTLFVPVCVIADDGFGNSRGLEKAIRWVVERQRRSRSRAIMLLSLSSVPEPEAQWALGSTAARAVWALVRARRRVNGMLFPDHTEAALDLALKTEILVVAAAGNSNADACGTVPGSMPGIVTVAASHSATDLTRAAFSNFGPCVTLFAPGVDIAGADASSDLGERTMSGTSSAAPLVAGRLAAFAKCHPALRSRQLVERFLQQETDPLGMTNLRCERGYAAEVCNATSRRSLNMA
jgi:subtilisin family serine protease